MAAPPPPPNIHSYKGNDKGLVRALLEWVWAYYRATVLEGFFVSNAEFLSSNAGLIDLIDPAAATAATAQQTANDALTLATVNDGRLDDIQVGTITINNTDTTGTAVVLFADDNYHVVYGAESSTGSPAAGAFTPVETAKTDVQITLTVQTAPGAATSVTFDFIAKRL